MLRVVQDGLPIMLGAWVSLTTRLSALGRQSASVAPRGDDRLQRGKPVG